jgi:hypothetical protein
VKLKHALFVAVAGALLLPVPAVMAQDRDQTQSRQTIQDRDIYGYQLMTPQERVEFRAKMRAAQTAEERERIRAEHHARMQERAKERGIALPDQPPARGGAGMGGGMGPGSGMGPGGGMGRGR